MNVDEALQGVATLLYHQGKLGLGWYARLRNSNEFAFGHSPSEAVAAAREARFIHNVETIIREEAQSKRRRLLIDDEPPIKRRRASLFD